MIIAVLFFRPKTLSFKTVLVLLILIVLLKEYYCRKHENNVAAQL